MPDLPGRPLALPRIRPLWLGLGWLALASGCLAPRYVRPEAPVADSWPEPLMNAQSGTAAGSDALLAELPWREQFTDPRLQAVIEAALDSNRDLRVAMLNVDRARAQYRIRLSDHLPQVQADASATASRQVFGPGLAAEGTVFRAGLSLPAYEIDLFGRMRYQSQSAFRAYLATEEGARAARISLIASAAGAWLAERAAADQLAVAREVQAAREEVYALTQARFDAGIANELELRQLAVLVETARANTAALTRAQAQAHNALTLVVGAPVPPSEGSLTEVQLVAELPAGLPSDLLTHRPDLRAAEHRLRAAHADIGAARAAFFPRITLTGSLGTASPELSGLFGAGAGVWSFVPAITQPIFGLARNISAHKVAKVDQQIAVAQYEKAIQVAFREVADALAAQATLGEQEQALARLRDAEERRRDLAQQRYDEGLASFLEVLDAQRSLFDAERSLIQARQARLANAVELYAALGGGAE